MNRYLPSLAVLILLACNTNPGTKSPTVGGESHFLTACTDETCGDGLSCVCGVCTRTCEAGACGDAAVCFERQNEAQLICSAAPAICLPVCTDADDGICATDGMLQYLDPVEAVPMQFNQLVTVGQTTEEMLPVEVAEAQHQVVVPPGDTSGRVVLFLPKSSSVPRHSQVFLASAALEGHFAFGLGYTRGPHDCDDASPPACWAAARRATVVGDGESVDSVLFRAESLLNHYRTLDERLFPGGAIDWSTVHIVAHRDAAPIAVEIARERTVASVGIVAGALVDHPSELADFEAPSTAYRFAVRADDDAQRADLEGQWTSLTGATLTDWAVSDPPADGTGWIVDPAGLRGLEPVGDTAFDSLLIDERFGAEQRHALRPLWRHLIGADR